MPKTLQEKKKKFECDDRCKTGYVEMVVIGCKKCQKKIAPLLTKKQLLEIAEIIKYNL